MKTILISLIKVYQLTISPLFGKNCRYHPSCSSYFIKSVEYKGIVKGSLLGLYRILRCNPFSLGGYDPVITDIKKEK